MLLNLTCMNQAEQIAKILLDIEAVKVSVEPPFTWNTGLNTPIYCDNRLVPSYTEQRKDVVNGLVNIVNENNLEFDVIAGTATAGIPWAAFVSYELDKPMVYVRAQPKDYGKAKQVEGFMPRGAGVLIVEDLISTGRSSLATATACKREYDAQVVGVVAIFTYQMQKAKNSFLEANIPLYTLSNFSTLLDVATKENKLSEADKVSALEWSTNPEQWSKDHGGV